MKSTSVGRLELVLKPRDSFKAILWKRREIQFGRVGSLRHGWKTSRIRYTMPSPSRQSNMQFFADLSAKKIIVGNLKDNNEEKTH
jgi:hypothetical protein